VTIDYAAQSSLTRMFLAIAADAGTKPFLWWKKDGEWHSLSYAETADRVLQMAKALREMGVESGERVALVSENRPEFLIADIAIMAAGGITVPTYTTNTVKDHSYILDHSEASGVIYSSKAIAKQLLPAIKDAKGVKFAVAMEMPDGDSGLSMPLVSWADAMAKGNASTVDLAPIMEAQKREDTACFIYTSGTGGTPKGVMLSHGAILCNCAGSAWLLEQFGLTDEVFLSFLPLSHSYEHSAGQFFPMTIQAQIYYAESVEKLSANLLEARPTIMTAVPRLYEQMHRRITSALERQGGLKAKLFHKALEIGLKRVKDPSSLTLMDRLIDTLLDKLVRSKVKARFGGRLKALVSGGAPLNPDIGHFFNALGVTLLQGYGQTEAAPVVSCNLPGKVKMHTVGPALPGVEVKIAEDGEILVRGELVMTGYWKDPDATAKAVQNGWLHTGDIGVLDEDGYIQITDRKKDIIVISGGDNVAPQRIEGVLTMQPEIAQAMVYGDKRPHIVALLVPDADWLQGWVKDAGKSADSPDLAQDPDLRKALEPVVSRVNTEMSSIERLRTFCVTTEPFSVDNEMMTPTLKIRRHKIKEVYGQSLEALYG